MKSKELSGKLRAWRPPLWRRIPACCNRLFFDRDAALRTELDFWDRWFRTRGLDWPEDYRRRLDPRSPLVAHLRPFVDPLPARSIAILDVGAGPLTMIGMTHPSKTLHIVATDLLAAEYDRLLARYAVIPPVLTIAVAAEELAQYFGDDRFELVHANNSLDHTGDRWLPLDRW